MDQPRRKRRSDLKKRTPRHDENASRNAHPKLRTHLRSQRQNRTASQHGDVGTLSSGWDRVAAWYDRLVGEEGSDYHRNVVLPAALRLLDPKPGERFIDLCCGQGVLARMLIEQKAGFVVGIDASQKLITAAHQRGPVSPALRYVVADACRLGPLADGSFDGAACVMAVQDVEDIDPLFAGIFSALRSGGRTVIVMMHPCFRIPRQSSWGWDEQKKMQYRRIDRYATPMSVPISIHPGREPGLHTTCFHRPLSAYASAICSSGLCITAIEELMSHRLPPRGSRSRGLTRAAREIPLFLAMRADKPDKTARPPTGFPEGNRHVNH